MPDLLWRPVRNGQWVKFQATLPAGVVNRQEGGLPAVHTTRDGWMVGIFSRGGADATGELRPSRVHLVAVTGENVEYLSPAGKLENVAFLPEEISVWMPLLDPADLPPGRPLPAGARLLP